MKRPLFPVFRHAAVMARRNLRSYTMLSVTIVMSFSLLLGYLGFTDATLYNRYKALFAQDRGFVYANDKIEQGVVDLLVRKAGELGNTQSQQAFCTTDMQLLFEHCTLDTGEELGPVPNPMVWSLPTIAWSIGNEIGADEITWLDGEPHSDIQLKSGQILMDNQLYYGLRLYEKDNLFDCLLLNQFSSESFDAQRVDGKFTVVGTIKSPAPMVLDTETEAGFALFTGAYQPMLIFSSEDVGPGIQQGIPWWVSLTFHSDAPEKVAQMLNSVLTNSKAITVYEAQDAALSAIRTAKQTKALVAGALLLLLGINLYSSFSNALNDRKFEIGVKRALGASSFRIVRQFLYESILVMLADILLSIVIVMDVLLVYKVIYEATPDKFGDFHSWILYISPYSIVMFAVCAVALTVVFSLIFAYKSTQVEIVEYLKAE